MRTLIPILAVALLVSCGGGGATPTALQEGRTVYGNVCSACHGSAGEGGVGPALDAVTVDFPACDDHIRWVTLGSERWKAEVGATYGATGKPVQGGMPEHGVTLSVREIATVVAWERVTYGRADATVTLEECGVGE